MTNKLSARALGFEGSDLKSQFRTEGYNPENARAVAHNFMNTPSSWRVSAPLSAGRPYGWGNDNGDWLTTNVNLSEMVVWSRPNFFIPTYEGDRAFHQSPQ